MSVNTRDSWSAQCFRVDEETESGPAALQGFFLLKSLLTSLSCRQGVVAVVGEEGFTWVGSSGVALAPAELGGKGLVRWGC